MESTTTYIINNIEFVVRRSFKNEKSVKELITEEISRKEEVYTFDAPVCS